MKGDFVFLDPQTCDRAGLGGIPWVPSCSPGILGASPRRMCLRVLTLTVLPRPGPLQPEPAPRAALLANLERQRDSHFAKPPNEWPELPDLRHPRTSEGPRKSQEPAAGLGSPNPALLREVALEIQNAVTSALRTRLPQNFF